jgi:hypothetical protein
VQNVTTMLELARDLADQLDEFNADGEQHVAIAADTLAILAVEIERLVYGERIVILTNSVAYATDHLRERMPWINPRRDVVLVTPATLGRLRGMQLKPEQVTTLFENGIDPFSVEQHNFIQTRIRP